MKSFNLNVRGAVRFALAACAAAAASQGAIASTAATTASQDASANNTATTAKATKPTARVIKTAKATKADAQKRILLAQATNPPAPPAATETTSTAAPMTTLQTVVVTGTLIALSPNDVSISPITSVNQKAFQNVGAVRIEDQLQNLPQFTAAQNSGEAIGSSGTATVNLYGLGAVRTLVLLNGRRMGPGGAPNLASVADIDQIPSALVQRVDVLTGGASSTYGADAVAGAVNFVLDTNFNGVKIDGTYSFNNHSNNNQADLALLSAFGAPLPPSTVNTGQNRDVSIVMGSDFANGKGNATAYFTFTSTSPSVGSQFDDAGCSIIGGDTKDSPLACGGSETMGTGAFVETGLVGTGTAAHTVGLVSDTVDGKSGVMRPIVGTDFYNYGATSYFQRSMKRYTGGAFVHYNLNDNMQVYSETMWANIETVAQYGPSADFFSPANISCANPLLTAQEVATLCNPTNLALNQAYASQSLGLNLDPNEVHLYIGRRDVEGGPRVDDYVSNSFREVLGTKGALGDAWSYDAFAMVSNSELQLHHNNNLGVIQIQNALDVIPDASGQPVCRSTTGISTVPTDTGCVPWNIWVPGGVTQEALNYMLIPAGFTETVREQQAQGTINGDLGQYGIKLPTANEGIKVAGGLDWREEWLDLQPSFVSQFGLTSGDSPIPPEHGNFNLWEIFGEARVPILSDKPFFNRLEADIGYRYSSYNLGFNTNTYKFQLEWAPVSALHVRAGYNRAVRAPNIDELFSGNSIGPGGVSDPCWGATPSLTQAQCALTGVSPANYGSLSVNPAAQINNETGGNVHLQPEIADTYTFGVVFRPEFVPGLSASLDYYDINIRNTIEALAASTVIQGCATGTTAFCGLIHRGPNGSLWQNQQTEFVVTTNQNIGKLRTKGAVLNVQYAMGVGGLGHLNLGLQGNWVRELITQPTPELSSAYDCAGFYGATCAGNGTIADGPIPHWRHVFTASWETPWAGLGVNLRWRYIGPTQDDGLSYNPNLSGDGYYTAADHIPMYNYFDLSASIPVVKGVTATLGVNNIADKEPPLVPSGTFSACPTVGCNDNTWPGMYDTMGRYIFLHVEARFGGEESAKE
ncbi:MAG TPA: TonB-dependent receptor [Steroidobacteraceae bacterium]|nr:TonB-dependent receptor [Steroidobacteraceae bacterium]